MGTAHKDLAADVVQSKPLVEPGHEFFGLSTSHFQS